ncbi:Protein of unknown function [Selenomonas ruminantium]|uniref:DUF2922 domain-containing protein n=1 Tax=Selenomonas ruminantium TaxID=971 RepID=A0A1I3IC52_SELRU|nr:DUF2922 domain-containing protein [Selenomonas ruminantium]SFI45538.1 Protein of unknown function [Selenomonas ruminantium]
MKKTLILLFNRSDGKTSELVISAPREDVTKAEVDAFATKVRETKFFLINGAQLMSLKKAFIRTVDDEDITA